MTSAETQAPRASRKLIIGITAAVLVVAAAIYAWRGQPKLLVGKPDVAAPAAAASAAMPSIDEMVQRLAERLARQPNDAEGWTMLGRSYLMLQRPAEAVLAFQKRRDLQPGDAQALADLADAMAFANGRSFDGEPEKLIALALKADPNNAKALELAGTQAFDRQDYKTASAQWQKAVAVMDPQSPSTRNLQAGIDEAQRRSGAAPANAGAQVSGRVVLSKALQSQIKPNDTVLIFARLVDGPRMPVAVQKRRASELPLSFKLDETTAMNPGLRLSPSMQVVVGARVSRSGQAMPQPGDLQGFSQPVPVGTKDIQIEISDTVK